MSDEVRQARRNCIGGSDARIIMSGDQEAIERLWREKRGEIEPEDLSDILIVQLGNCTEALNTDWFEKQTGYVVTHEQERPSYEFWPVAMSTLDGIVRETIDGEALGIFEAKWMIPFGWSKDKAVEKYYPQVQHNMMVYELDRSWLSIITGGGQYVCIPIENDPFYTVSLLAAEKDFWDCVQTGRVPGNPVIATPEVEAIQVLDMTGSNAWADLSVTLQETKPFVDKHEKAKKDLKALFPAEAKVASGHGVTVSRSKDKKVLIKLDK